MKIAAGRGMQVRALVVVVLISAWLSIPVPAKAAEPVGVFFGSSKSTIGFESHPGDMSLVWSAHEWREGEVRPGYLTSAEVHQSALRASYAPWGIGPFTIGLEVGFFQDDRPALREVLIPDLDNEGEYKVITISESAYRKSEVAVGLLAKFVGELGSWKHHAIASLSPRGASFQTAAGYQWTEGFGLRVGLLSLPGDDWYSGPYVGFYGWY